MQNKIGVLGGTFNPVHIGHMIMAQDALEEFGLSQVLFVPAAQPPHKPSTATLAPARHRTAMLEIALEHDLRFELCDIELGRPGLSYSVDTIKALRQQCSGAGLVFIIGSDSLLELHAWKDITDLLALCEFGVIPRPGFPLDLESLRRTGLPEPWPDRLLGRVARGHHVAVSSSDIRHRVAEGLSIRYLVHSRVDMYITEHALYRGRL